MSGRIKILFQRNSVVLACLFTMSVQGVEEPRNSKFSIGIEVLQHAKIENRNINLVAGVRWDQSQFEARLGYTNGLLVFDNYQQEGSIVHFLGAPSTGLVQGNGISTGIAYTLYFSKKLHQPFVSVNGGTILNFKANRSIRIQNQGCDFDLQQVRGAEFYSGLGLGYSFQLLKQFYFCPELQYNIRSSTYTGTVGNLTDDGASQVAPSNFAGSSYKASTIDPQLGLNFKLKYCF